MKVSLIIDGFTNKFDTMYFETNNAYHIYNQGNNHQKIFFTHENYMYFIRKLHDHILPYADILAWCLMPNHFHLMVLVNNVVANSEAFTLGDKLITQPSTESEGFTTLNDSIGTMLRSYTRAINIQEGRTGSLFRRKTKAEYIAKVERSVKPSPVEITSPDNFLAQVKDSLTVLISDREYLQNCFDYIHHNPQEAGIVKGPKDWEFSSFREYCGLRNWKLINKQTVQELGLQLVKPSL